MNRKEVGYLCCAAGKVEFVAKLPRTGYNCATNDDVIPLTVDVENSSTRVIQMRARIMKWVSLFPYLQNQSQKQVSKDIEAEITSESIQPHSSYVWNPTNWLVPVLTPTLFGSKVINVDYVLEVTGVIPHDTNLSCNIPLLMGNPYKTSGNLDLATLSPGANVTAAAVLHGGSSVPADNQEAQNQSHGDTMNKEEDYGDEHVI